MTAQIRHRSIIAAAIIAIAAMALTLLYWPANAAIAPSTAPDAPGRDRYLNVRDFGAVGDGKADDTQAVLDAFQAAGKPDPGHPGPARPTEVFIPAGVYRLTKTIEFDPSLRLVHLQGEGMLLPKGTMDGHSTLLWDGPKGAPMFNFKGYAALRISDIKLDGAGKAGVLLRINSKPGVGTAWFYTERVFLDRADTAIELGADMDMGASDMTFVDVLMDHMKTCGFRAMHGQQVNYVFMRCEVMHAPTGFAFPNGGSAHFILPTFFAVNTCFDLSGGVNNGSYSITGLFLERGSLSDPDKRMVILNAHGEVNIAISAIQSGCQNVWGDKADFATPNFILGSHAQVTVRDSILSGKTATLAGSSGPPTWIQFDNCRFSRGAEPRKDIDADQWSGFELRNCSITVDDTRGKQYKQIRCEMVPHLARYPKQAVTVEEK